MIQKLENSSSTIQQWVIAKSKNDTDAANVWRKILQISIFSDHKSSGKDYQSLIENKKFIKVK